jgi:mannose-6-phosphate isomerase-like protein (cupin superfamily)
MHPERGWTCHRLYVHGFVYGKHTNSPRSERAFMYQTVVAACCLVGFVGVLALVPAASGQSSSISEPSAPTVQLWTSKDLNQQAKTLLSQAAATNGSAGSTLTRLPNQYTMLTTRNSSGGAELHTQWCDYLVVLDGEGVELTGGAIVDRHDEANGEVRGTRLEGAKSYSLHKGDIIFIPSGTPHQAIEAPGKSITVFVIKSAASAPAHP